MNARVWVVIQGHYSNKRVRAVFSSEEKARAWIAIYDNESTDLYAESDFSIQDPETIDEPTGDWVHHPQMHPFQVRLREEGAHPLDGTYGKSEVVAVGATVRRCPHDPDPEDAKVDRVVKSICRGC